MRCDNSDLASQCGLNTSDLITSASYIPGELRWDTTVVNCTDQLYIVKCWAWLPAPPPALPCTPGQVRSCARPWSQSASACPLYSLPVVATDGTVYHNPHCAACNGQDINQTTCAIKSRPLLPNRGASLFTRFLFPSMSFLLQFRPDLDQSQNHQCGSNQFFDSLYKRCYSLKCGDKYVNIAGYCVRWRLIINFTYDIFRH